MYRQHTHVKAGSINGLPSGAIPTGEVSTLQIKMNKLQKFNTYKFNTDSTENYRYLIGKSAR